MPNHIPTITSFKKGHIPWSKGKKLWQNKINPMKGKHMSNESKEKMRLKKLGIYEGSNNPNYKGNTPKLRKDLWKQAWKRKVKEIKLRDNYECCSCLSNEKLQVHHIYRLDIDNSNLLTLCQDCHMFIHGGK